MPVTKQAIKRVRSSRRKTSVNFRRKKALKKVVAAFRKNPTEEKLKQVYGAADKAAKTNVIHKNKAARIKSRLTKVLKSLTKKKSTH